MNVTLVEINIKPERVDEFLEVFRANHEGRSGAGQPALRRIAGPTGENPVLYLRSL